MASSEAQMRAAIKYNKKHTVQYYLRFNVKTDADIISKLDEVGNKQGYIKRLIRADLAKEEGDL